MSAGPPQLLVVTTTVATLHEARELARLIVERRLAACVQIDPAVTSFYRWEGARCEDPEVRLIIKTLPACEAALQALFAQHHPYELPQFVATVAQASPPYFEWVRSEVQVPPK